LYQNKDATSISEQRSGTCYLAGVRVSVLIVKSAGMLSTKRFGTYLQITS